MKTSKCEYFSSVARAHSLSLTSSASLVCSCVVSGLGDVTQFYGRQFESVHPLFTYTSGQGTFFILLPACGRYLGEDTHFNSQKHNSRSAVKAMFCSFEDCSSNLSTHLFFVCYFFRENLPSSSEVSHPVSASFAPVQAERW